MTTDGPSSLDAAPRPITLPVGVVVVTHGQLAPELVNTVAGRPATERRALPTNQARRDLCHAAIRRPATAQALVKASGGTSSKRGDLPRRAAAWKSSRGESGRC
jgi:hypothetical protein